MNQSPKCSCAVCGVSLPMTDRRYKLILVGLHPVCRKNGCEQIVGAPNLGGARTRQITHVDGVTDWVSIPSTRPRAEFQEVLAKRRVRSYYNRQL